MHTGIGTPRCDDGNGLTGNMAECVLNIILHGAPVSLAMPAIEIAAVIFDPQRNSHRHTETSITLSPANRMPSIHFNICTGNSNSDSLFFSGTSARSIPDRQSLAVSCIALSAYCRVKANLTAMRSRDKPTYRKGYASTYKPLISLSCESEVSRRDSPASTHIKRLSCIKPSSRPSLVGLGR